MCLFCTFRCSTDTVTDVLDPVQFLREMHRRMVDSNLHSLTFQDTDVRSALHSARLLLQLFSAPEATLLLGANRRPWVFVRLDEGELHPELLRQIVATANRHRALTFLVLVFDSREQVEAMWRTRLWAGKVMRNFPVQRPDIRGHIA